MNAFATLRLLAVHTLVIGLVLSVEWSGRRAPTDGGANAGRAPAGEARTEWSQLFTDSGAPVHVGKATYLTRQGMEEAMDSLVASSRTVILRGVSVEGDSRIRYAFVERVDWGSGTCEAIWIDGPALYFASGSSWGDVLSVTDVLGPPVGASVAVLARSSSARRS